MRLIGVLLFAIPAAFCATLNFDLISSESLVRCELGSDVTIQRDLLSAECTTGGIGRFVRVEAHSDITGIGGLMSVEGAPTHLSFEAYTTVSLTVQGLRAGNDMGVFRFGTRCGGTGEQVYRFRLEIDGEERAARSCTEGFAFLSAARHVSPDMPIIIGMFIAGELARSSSSSAFSAAGGSMEFWDASVNIPEPAAMALFVSGLLMLAVSARGRG